VLPGLTANKDEPKYSFNSKNDVLPDLTPDKANRNTASIQHWYITGLTANNAKRYTASIQD
jgi:hypothetical protein